MDQKQIEHKLILRYQKVKEEFGREKSIQEYRKSMGIDYEKELFDKLEAEYSLIKDQLTNLKDKPGTESKLYTLIGQLSAIHENLVLHRYGYKIDRNQGMIIENYIYGDIIKDITWAISTEFGGHTIPHYMYSTDSDFDHEPVRNLIRKYIDELRKENFENYPKFHEKFEEIKAGIAKLGEEEYTANKGKSTQNSH